MDCLLCKSKNVKVIEELKRNDVIKLWAGSKIDVLNDLKTSPVLKYHCNNCDLTFYDPQNAGGDAFYSQLGAFDWYYLHEGKSEYAFIQKYINDGDKILDIGSGRGVLFSRIKKKVDYTGLELSSKAVELAKQDGVNVINEDLLVHAEQNAGQYDLVCLFQVLEHLTELDHFINAIKKCLKPNGLFCVAVPNNDGFLKDTINNAFNMPPHHTLLWNKKSLEKLGELFNLETVEVCFEELQDVHKEWFFRTSVYKKLRPFVAKKHRTVDFGMVHSKLESLVGRLTSSRFVGTKLKNRVLNQPQKGHSIIYVYRKNEG